VADKARKKAVRGHQAWVLLLDGGKVLARSWEDIVEVRGVARRYRKGGALAVENQNHHLRRRKRVRDGLCQYLAALTTTLSAIINVRTQYNRRENATRIIRRMLRENLGRTALEVWERHEPRGDRWGGHALHDTCWP